jgi:hypothetical protein
MTSEAEFRAMCRDLEDYTPEELYRIIEKFSNLHTDIFNTVMAELVSSQGYESHDNPDISGIDCPSEGNVPSVLG